MSISNVPGVGSIAALPAMQQSGGPGGGAQADLFAQLLGGASGGGPLQILQLLGPGSPLTQLLQGSLGGLGNPLSSMGMPDLADGLDDDSDSDDDSDLA